MMLSNGLHQFSTSNELETALVTNDKISHALMAHRFMLLESNGFQIKTSFQNSDFKIEKKNGEVISGLSAWYYVFSKAGISKSNEELDDMLNDWKMH